MGLETDSMNVRGNPVMVSGVTVTGLIHLRDEKLSGTVGGSSSATTWQVRDLTVKPVDTGGNCSLAANQFTLQPGTYNIRSHSPGWDCARSKARLYNVTDSAVEIHGSTEYNNLTSAVVKVEVWGQFTITATKTFELQHYTELAKVSDGLGIPSSAGTEVYSEVWLEKVAD